MVTVNNDDLREVYHYLATIENVIQKEINLVKGNKNHLDKMVPEGLSRFYSEKQKTALGFVDNLYRIAYENAVLMLISTFERVVFSKYRTAYGGIKTVIRDHASKPMNFFDSRERFVNDGIDQLAGILYLIDGIIDNELNRKLKILKDLRNYLAHGKRDSVPPSVDYSIHEIVKILDDTISEIEK
ncbi:MAG: hypothetical protein H6581_13015 [Bacteroidia bacterium]|nr:hypothetical protein [Bacteroidia bacterium]